MMDRAAIEQVLAQYARHGWTLRRVLLSEPAGLGDTAGLFSGIEITPSAGLDAMWFSRASRPGVTAWELRHLSTTPYALVENIRSDASADEADAILKDAEARMSELIAARLPGH